MNSQEKKIVVAGVVIAALSSAGISMGQGDFNHIDDDYQSPAIISEKTLASNDSNSISLVKTDIAIVDENNEEEEVKKIELKDESNKEVTSKVNTLNKTSKPQINTSTSQTKPAQKPTKPEEKPIEPEVIPEVPEEKPIEPEATPEVPEEKPTEPEVTPEVPSTDSVEESIPQIETPSVEIQFDMNIE